MGPEAIMNAMLMLKLIGVKNISCMELSRTKNEVIVYVEDELTKKEYTYKYRDDLRKVFRVEDWKMWTTRDINW